MVCAIYARVSTAEQNVENQLAELQRYASKRGWQSELYVDSGVSGTRESRPNLDRLITDARRRKIDVVLCWRLDRLGRSLRHLLVLLDELDTLGVKFVSLHENIDTTTPAGRLQMQVLGAIAEFERGRLGERVRAGLARARKMGVRLGRPSAVIPVERLQALAHLPAPAAAHELRVSLSTVKRWRKAVQKTSSELPTLSPDLPKDFAGAVS